MLILDNHTINNIKFGVNHFRHFNHHFYFPAQLVLIGGFTLSDLCSARWIWHLFISRRCYAVYDLRRQAPTTTTTRIPDPRTYLPPVGCPTSFFYPPRLPQERKEKKIRYKFSTFFVGRTHTIVRLQTWNRRKDHHGDGEFRREFRGFRICVGSISTTEFWVVGFYVHN